MKTTKKMLLATFILILGLTSCKKEKTIQPQKEEIILSNLPTWANEADLISKTETTLSDAEYEKIKTAIGTVEVKFAITAGKPETLPYYSFKNDIATTFYYQWSGKKLTIYKQRNKFVAELLTKPGDVQLVFYALK